MEGMENLKITVEAKPGQSLPVGAKTSFWVNENRTVSNIKDRIESETMIPSDDQILVYRTTPLLDEYEKLRDIVKKPPVQPARANTTLTLLTKSIKPSMLFVPVIMVDDNDRKIEAKVEWSATVGQLKTKIDEMEGIPPSRQNLLARLRGSNSEFVPFSKDNARLVEVYYEGSTVYLYIDPPRRGDTLPITVVVTSSPDLQATFDMDVDVDTVYTLAAKVKKSVILETLPATKTFSLHLGRQCPQNELIRGDSTLRSYGINAPNFIVYFTPSYL